MTKCTSEYINEFRRIKPESFNEIPLKQRLEYLDALTLQNRTAADYAQDYNGLFDNIKACLFSIRVSPEFMNSEKSSVNHFINGLTGLSLDNALKDVHLRSPEQKKSDICKFIDLFCNIYATPQPEIIFQNPDSAYSAFCSASKGKRIRLAENFLSQDMKWHDYSIVFHEMIHIYQHHLHAKDPEKYKIFTPEYNNLKFGTWMAHQGNVQEKYQAADEIYELLPGEAHAYSMQTFFTDLFADRVLNKHNYLSGKMDYRNIWFSQQR